MSISDEKKQSGDLDQCNESVSNESKNNNLNFSSSSNEVSEFSSESSLPMPPRGFIRRREVSTAYFDSGLGPEEIPKELQFDDKDGSSKWCTSKVMSWNEEKGGKKYMEDTLMTWDSPNNIISVGAVFDGHGSYNGMIASHAARQHLQIYLKENAIKCEKWSASEWKEKLPILFIELHDYIRIAFLRFARFLVDTKTSSSFSMMEEKFLDNGIVRFNSNYRPVLGGTTATICIFLRNFKETSKSSHKSTTNYTIITANVGDSDAFIISKKGKFHRISTDHSPDNSDEYLRIQKLDNSECPLKPLFVYEQKGISKNQRWKCPQIFTKDGSGKKIPEYAEHPWDHHINCSNVRLEPAVYCITPEEAKDQVSLAMTRSLGDFYANTYGISHSPSINVEDINEDCMIVLATDGIWDGWKFKDIASCIHSKWEKAIRKKKIKGLFSDKKKEKENNYINNIGNDVFGKSMDIVKKVFGNSYDDACLILCECQT